MEKIKGGYYIKARKIQESEIAHAPPHIREIWDWLLKEANHSNKKYNGFIVKRGQLFRTYKEIREGLHWMVGYRKMTYNENHTKKAMKYLREHLMITSSKELGGVLITVLNYNYYQDPRNYDRTTERPNERTNAEPMRNHPLPVNNKNEKNEKKNISCQNNSNSDCPYHEILKLYHEVLPELPKTAKLTAKRKGQIKARWFESEKTQSLEWWKGYFEKVKGIGFLMGENNRGWRADLEFLTRQEKFLNIIEGGKY